MTEPQVKNNVPLPTGSDAEKEAARQKAEQETLKLAGADAQLATPAISAKRTFTRTVKKVHDLFKLKVATCQKNISYVLNKIQLETVEHVHFYHTIDSHGFAQEFSSFVAGHTHRVKVTIKGDEVSAVCEAAVKEIEKKTKGGNVVKSFGRVYLGETEKGVEVNDDHTHEILYVRSEQLDVNV